MGSAKSDEGAEEALRESEERFRQVVSTTPDAVMIFDVETREFIEVNGACEKLYGYTREEFLALRHNDITAEQAESDDSIHRTRKGELDHIPVHYHRKKDGTVFPVEISGSSFTSGGRKVLCGVVRDITRHVEADRALRESEEKYRSLVETSQDLIWQCDGAGRFTYLNPAWEQVTGRKLDEMLGRRFTDFQTPEIAARDVKEFQHHLAGGQVRGYETTHVSKSGEDIHLVFNAIPLHNSEAKSSARRGPRTTSPSASAPSRRCRRARRGSGPLPMLLSRESA